MPLWHSHLPLPRNMSVRKGDRIEARDDDCRMNRHVIIVAGGKGLRMGGDIPKQFLPVGGKPVLMRTIEAFYAFDSSMHIILVLPVSQQAYWKDLCETYHLLCVMILPMGARLVSIL